jgi:phosphate transport system permease protein
MMSLPLMAFTLVQLPEDTEITRGFAAAAVLLLMVLALFFIARAIGGRGPGQLTARQQRRRVAQSQRDAVRYTRRAELALATGTGGLDLLVQGDPRGHRRRGRAR